jgi:hypothetical protein
MLLTTTGYQSHPDIRGQDETIERLRVALLLPGDTVRREPMLRISPEMTLRDIAEAINRGELDQEDAGVRAAVRERMRVIHQEFTEVDAVAPTDRRLVKPVSVSRLARRLNAVVDEEKQQQARMALGRIEDALGSQVPGRKRFPTEGEAP